MLVTADEQDDSHSCWQLPDRRAIPITRINFSETDKVRREWTSPEESVILWITVIFRRATPGDADLAARSAFLWRAEGAGRVGSRIRGVLGLPVGMVEMTDTQMVGVPSDPPGTWEDLRATVVGNNGVFRINMGTLREIGGYGRLGTNVRQILSRNLAGIGLGHLPTELPSYQDKEVLLFQFGTPAAEIVEAVREGASDGAESALVRLNSSQDIAKVRDASLKAVELLSILNDRCRDCMRPLH